MIQGVFRRSFSLLSQFGAGRQLINRVTRYNVTFPSKQQKRGDKQLGYTGFTPNKLFQDDLYYPMENDIHRKALDDLINHIKTHPNLTIEGRGLCTILYMIAKNDLYEPFIFRELERHLYKFKETLSARLAFGGLYASYKSNCASTYQISFFEEEFFRTSEWATAYDAIELLNAMYLNNTKVLQYKQEYFTRALRPVIIAKFDTQMRPYNQNLNNLFFGMYDMKIFDEELFEKILKYLPYRRGQTNVQTVAKVYETLCEMKQSGVLKQSLDAHITHLEKRLSTREDFKWRYNVEEKRHYSYDELVANRDNYTIEGQMQHKYRFSNPELIEKFNLVQSDKDAIKAEMEARERSRELENLVLEMFDLKARGEVSQVEDTNTLLGSYENIIFVKEGEELEDEVDENAEEEDDSSEPFEEDIEDEVSLKSEDGPKKSKKPFKSKKLTKN